MTLYLPGIGGPTTSAASQSPENSLNSAVYPSPPRFVLSLEYGVSYQRQANITTSNIYYEPLNGNSITLYNGSEWAVITSAALTINLTGTAADTNYDVFVYNNSGSLAHEIIAWTDDSTRATALAKQDGMWVKSGDSTRLYVGSFRTTTAGTTERQAVVTSDGALNTKSLLFNTFNQTDLVLLLRFDFGSWTYTTTGVWRKANNAVGWESHVFLGLPSQIDAEYSITLNTNATQTTATVSISTDGVLPDHCAKPGNSNSLNPLSLDSGLIREFSAGFHTLLPFEHQNSAGSGVFFGDNNLAPGVLQAVLQTKVKC